MRYVKAILFDLGDVFYTVDYEKINKEMIERTGVPIKSFTETKRYFYKDYVAGKITTEEYFDSLRKAANSNASIPLLRKVYAAAYVKYSKIDRKMLSLASELHKRYRLICITNTSPLHKEINMERGLFDVFDQVFASAEAKRIKNVEWFKEILAELKIKSAECVFVDDLEENVGAARAAGIDSIQFTDYESLIRELSVRKIEMKP